MTKKSSESNAGRWSDWEQYLRPAHLQGRKTTVKIARIAIEETHPRPGKAEHAPVLYFEGKSKGLILSATNRRKLAELFGDDINGCIGQSVTLETVPVQVGRDTRTPIRISAASPTSGAVPILQVVGQKAG